VWRPEDRAPQTSLHPMLIVLTENQANKKLDAWNPDDFVADLSSQLNFAPTFSVPPSLNSTATKRCNIFAPHRTFRRQWQTLLEFFDPSISAAADSKDEIESHVRLGGYLGFIPDCLQSRLQNFGFNWSPSLEEQIRQIILNASLESIKRWHIWKWKKRKS